jgi:N-methylhydantoinase B
VSGPIDAVRLEVYRHLFASIAEEMGGTLLRSSFSANIKERRDFSCAVFDGVGRMIAQAAHIPVHLGSTPRSVQAAIEAVGPGPGDVVVLNDPFAGGTHLPDVTLVAPVHAAGDDAPLFHVANRAHHADIGGAQPGSMSLSRSIHEEGLRIPPVRLLCGGEMVEEVLDLLLANVRTPESGAATCSPRWRRRDGARSGSGTSWHDAAPRRSCRRWTPFAATRSGGCGR